MSLTVTLTDALDTEPSATLKQTAADSTGCERSESRTRAGGHVVGLGYVGLPLAVEFAQGRL